MDDARPAPEADPTKVTDDLLEALAGTLVRTVSDVVPGSTTASADLRLRVAQLREAVRERHPTDAAGPDVGHAERAELAVLGDGFVAAVHGWSIEDPEGGPVWARQRQQALEAARALHDGLRVHHAHERARAGPGAPGL
ncbi:hypothetical protein ACIB24_02840 [Spongisporangium articulatum]|uniref:Uncharacterized protein n=1 Tax=Spongisporangium articulatum TaxID=3362603 RepID=A0ABW8AJ17_9ACTN